MQREYPERPIIGVGGVLFKDQSVLLAKRAQAPFKGQWSLPGGVVEIGETLEQALKRELLEEASIEIEIGGLIRITDRIIHDKDKKIQFHYVIAGYWGWPAAGQPTARSDISDIKFADLGQISNFKLDKDTYETISLGMEALRAWSREQGA